MFDDDVASDAIVGVGFYGPSVRFAHGYGGWEPFGPPRRITRAEGNVLYELDGAPALDLYKRYLGEWAQDLPASGLMFPFDLLDDTRSDLGLIRTILGVDEASKSLTLAGDLVDGGYLRLMHASVDRLVAGAETADAARATGPRDGDALAILVSCIGRHLTMGDRVEEEVEAVSATLGDDDDRRLLFQRRHSPVGRRPRMQAAQPDDDGDAPLRVRARVTPARRRQTARAADPAPLRGGRSASARCSASSRASRPTPARRPRSSGSFAGCRRSSAGSSSRTSRPSATSRCARAASRSAARSSPRRSIGCARSPRAWNAESRRCATRPTGCCVPAA